MKQGNFDFAFIAECAFVSFEKSLVAFEMERTLFGT